MISLSLCMIVKNEEAVLERILKPVSQVMDAILIADRHGTIEYSAMFSEQENGLADEGFIGKNILEAYPQLTEETSSQRFCASE